MQLVSNHPSALNTYIKICYFIEIVYVGKCLAEIDQLFDLFTYLALQIRSNIEEWSMSKCSCAKNLTSNLSGKAPSHICILTNLKFHCSCIYGNHELTLKRIASKEFNNKWKIHTEINSLRQLEHEYANVCCAAKYFNRWWWKVDIFSFDLYVRRRS